MRRYSFVPLLVVGLLAVTAAGCGSDSTSPQQQACDDSATLKDSVQKLVDDVKQGNLGDAKDQVSTVKTDFEAFTASVKDLAETEKSAVQDDVDTIKSTLGDLTSASSLSDVEGTLTKARSQLQSAVDDVTKTLSC